MGSWLVARARTRTHILMTVELREAFPLPEYIEAKEEERRVVESDAVCKMISVERRKSIEHKILGPCRKECPIGDFPG